LRKEERGVGVGRGRDYVESGLSMHLQSFIFI